MRYLLATALEMLPMHWVFGFSLLGGGAFIVASYTTGYEHHAERFLNAGIGVLVVTVIAIWLWHRLIAWVAYGRGFRGVVVALVCALALTGSVAKAEVLSFTGVPTVSGEARYTPMIEGVAKAEGVPAGLLLGIARCESAFNPHALSPKGASGMFQLMPSTARRFGADPRDPRSAAYAAARYLKTLHDEFGQWALAIAAYNAGEYAVRRYNGLPPFNETRAFVSRVLATMALYNGDTEL